MSVKRQPLLIVAETPALLNQMGWASRQYEVAFARDRKSAVAQFRRLEPAVVALDLGLPPRSDDPTEGLRLLEEVLAIAPGTKVIVLTGQDARANAVEAIGLGACDFYVKPLAPEILALVVDRAYRVHELEEENRRLRSARTSAAWSGILTRDPGVQRLCRAIERVAATDATVLLLGEPGTGKTSFARALHELSRRARHRFVPINCAAIPTPLLESELFGHERSALAGVAGQAPGKIETAHRGTLFLRNVGDLPSAVQARLSRFLQERVIRHGGGREDIAVDVRIVCAGDRSLKDAIATGGFREDLYYRLAEIVLEIPPLRTRQGDASLLAHAFLGRFAGEQRRGSLTLLPEAIDAVESHSWPGNVRELENVIERAVITAAAPTIRASDINPLMRGAGGAKALDLRQAREQAERLVVTRALGRANGNLSRAAELLGVSRPTLYDLMHRFGLRGGHVPTQGA